MLSVSLVFAVNDLLALKSFNTFLNNFQIHENPNLVSRYLAKWSQRWIQARSLKIFSEVRTMAGDNTIDVALNKCSTGMFAVLSLATTPSFQPKQGTELFLSIASAELAFEKLRAPQPDSTYKQ
jgi:hypothetical protein